MTKIIFRYANIEDVELLQYWDKQPHVIASDPDDDWEWETELLHDPKWREQLVAELDGRPVGFVQIIDPKEEETHYWGNDIEENLRAIDIWIGEADDLGKGYGTRMMRLAIERCFADPRVTAIIIDPLSSNTRAIKFYEKIGFEFIEKRILGKDECHVMKLEKFPG